MGYDAPGGSCEKDSDLVAFNPTAGTVVWKSADELRKPYYG